MPQAVPEGRPSETSAPALRRALRAVRMRLLGNPTRSVTGAGLRGDEVSFHAASACHGPAVVQPEESGPGAEATQKTLLPKRRCRAPHVKPEEVGKVMDRFEGMACPAMYEVQKQKELDKASIQKLLKVRVT